MPAATRRKKQFDGVAELCGRDTERQLVENGIVSAVMLLRSQNSSVKRTSNPFGLTRISLAS
jgi:hypothetical protein